MAKLKGMFEEVFSDYEKYVKIGEGNDRVKDRRLLDLVNDLIPKKIEEILQKDIDKFFDTFNKSIGQGRKTSIPWFHASNHQFSTNASNGIYIVYLIPANSSKMYLAIARAATELKQSRSWKTEIEQERNNVKEFLDNEYRYDVFDMNLGDKGNYKDYKDSTLCFIEYSKEKLPDEEVLISDLLNIAKDYKAFVLKDKKQSENQL